MNGAELIAAERQRQIDVEGWTEEHDDEHENCEMKWAAYSYLAAVNSESGRPGMWPWPRAWWKPSDNPIRNLTKAGALIAAEIDRLQRKAHTDALTLEAKQKQDAIEELKRQPVSDPEKFVRCDWCGNEMPKPEKGTPVCDDCMPF